MDDWLCEREERERESKISPGYNAILPELHAYANEMNEINGGLGHICAHIGSTGPGEHPEDGELNVMTLPSRHTDRNSSLAVRGQAGYLSVMETLHNIESSRVSGE